MHVSELDKPSQTSWNDEHFDLLLATNEIGLWELDVKTGVAKRNLRHDQIFGHDEMMPHWDVDTFLKVVVPHERERIATLIESSIAQAKGWHFEVAIMLEDGTKRWIRASGVPKCDDNGEMISAVGHVIDITGIKQTEEKLQLLADELNHRVKNTLAVVQSIAKRTFPRNDPNAPKFLDRMLALAEAHDALLHTSWTGADLRMLVESIIGIEPSEAFEISPDSPQIMLAPTVTVPFAMAFHELSANAIKYGSLSAVRGTVAVDWRLSEDAKDLVVTWKERDGPQVGANQEAGFGTFVIKNSLATATQGTVDMDFDPAGLIVTVRVPLDAVLLNNP